MSKTGCMTRCLHWAGLALLLTCTLGHAALLFYGSKTPLTGIPLYAPGFEVRAEGMKIVKPAAGYPCFPDHSVKAEILEHLKNREKLGILLSESFGMTPDASICGMIFIHREASYPDIRHIGMEQFADYCRRRGLDEAQGRLLLGHLLD